MYLDQVELIQGCKIGLQPRINVIYHINRLKNEVKQKKTYDLINRCKIVFDKIQYLLFIRTLRKLGTELFQPDNRHQ